MSSARARGPYGGGVFIADKSAWSRAHRESVREEWDDAFQKGQIATCPIVSAELLQSVRSGAEFDELAADLAELRDLPVTRSVTNAALRALRQLAYAGLHRSVKLPDLLIAAAAEDAAVGVLHYDADYDTLATVLNFQSRWIAPQGTLP